MPSARRISAIASVPVPTPTARARAARGGELRFERLHLRAEHEPAAGDDALDRRRAAPGGVLSGASERNGMRGDHRVSCAAST